MVLALLLLLLPQVASAGELVVDAKVPARVMLDGTIVAELYREGVLRLVVPEGLHKLVVSVDGSPKPLDVEVAAEPVVVLIGRSGVSAGTVASAPVAVAAGLSDVRFRTAGNERLMLLLDTQRITISPGKGVMLPLAVGDHPMSVRSVDGTSVYARGVLSVTGGADMVVQVTEGSLPETAGAGLSFTAGGP